MQSNTISRRNVLAGAGAAAGGLALACPAMANVLAQGQTADARPSPFINAMARLDEAEAAWETERDDDTSDAIHDKLVEPAEMGVADAQLADAKDALAAFDYLREHDLIENCHGTFGVMVDSMVDGIRAYLAKQAGGAA